MLSGTSSFPRKRTGHKLTAIPACHKRRQSPIATRGAQLKSVKIKEKAEPETPIASRFSLVPVAGLEPARYRYRWILSFTGCGAMSGL